MNRLSRLVVFGSLLAAVAIQVRLGARELGELLPACEIAFVLAFAAAAWLPTATMSVAIALSYVAPALLMLAVGRFRLHYLLIWIALMLGGLAASRPLRGWALPPRWRWPLVTWALVIVATWPIVLWREADFNVALFSQYNPANTSRGVAPPVAAMGILEAVTTQLLGLLWFDWLYERFRQQRMEIFSRFVTVPLAIAVAVACVLGIYQGFVDVAFLSAGQWPTLQRAAGALLDANAFGMVAACWAPAFVALAWQAPVKWRVPVAATGVALAWSGLWASGSRTALLAGGIGLGTVLGAAVLRLHGAKRRWGLIAAGTALAVAVLVFTMLPLPSIGPVQRVRAWVAGAPTPGVSGILISLWQRDGYGAASTQAIRESPWVGVGVGSFTLLSLDYAMAAAKLPVEYDNAQNWFRHQLAELGVLGSIGWIAWVILFLPALLRAPTSERERVPASAIKGALLGLTAASMLGVPAQVMAVSLTFWTFVFWFLMLSVPVEYENTPVPATLGRSAMAWGVICALVLTHAAVTVHAARFQFSVPLRAQRFGWDYHYGFHDPEKGPEGIFRWTGRTAVAVVPVAGRSFLLDVWTGDPRVSRQPMGVKVWVNGELVVDTQLRDGSHVKRQVPLPERETRMVVRTEASRTWRPDRYGIKDSRELGVAVADWKFEQ